MFFLGGNFVASLICTLKSKNFKNLLKPFKNLKNYLKNLKTFSKKPSFFSSPGKLCIA